ncbi:potassium transporter Kup [Zavarzinia sp. CC-PAN008]|uniref:potassium transporter Kup n=1 Tax=Zavarzinia sp. CC-PAN008 TaxID=3243332 RepID=UPI003F746CC9
MQSHGSTRALFIGAVGIVFGDIGTSPLYAIKECFVGPHPLAVDREHVFGVLSLIFWSVTLVVSLKYVSIIMRADNKGEGGSLALLARVSHLTHGTRLTHWVGILGIFAAALFFGDSIITPAISVLSAVEGLSVVSPVLEPFVVPLTLAILVVMFAIQHRGTHSVGALFGPVMLTWFAVLGTLGVIQIVQNPWVLLALNPYHAIYFFALDGWIAFLTLGSVVLVVTGCEALYTDMGHFGRRPIRLAWFYFVGPCLLLNYFGQGALLLADPEAASAPFFNLAPDWARLPLVGLATMAAVIASQAVISGAFSLTRQAIQLGYLPRMRIVHTSAQSIGQVYLPGLNWTLAICVFLLVLGFQSSSHLAAAYGIAVTGTMMIDLALVTIVIVIGWRWNRWLVGALVGLFAIIDLAYFGANMTKVLHGGWFPLVVATIAFVLLTTWKRGRAILFERVNAHNLDLDTFLASISDRAPRVAGTAVFMTANSQGVPGALLHNLKHNRVMHERVIILCVRTEETPYVFVDRRIELSAHSNNVHRMMLRYGFMEDPNVPDALTRLKEHGLEIDPMQCSFFLSREVVVPSENPGMALWRERLFALMSRSATSAMSFFRLPPDRVVELGTQVEI